MIKETNDTSINYLDASQRMSQVVVHNDIVYLSGQVPSDPGADMQGQTQQVLDAIDERLEKASSDKDRLLRGERPGRQSDETITVFKSVGASLKDLAAIEVWSRLAENDTGTA